jgi:hypothetical protein
MTGGQTALSLDQDAGEGSVAVDLAGQVDLRRLLAVNANESEISAHEQWLERLRKTDDGCAWDRVV